MDAQHCEYTKRHWLAHVSWVDCIAKEIYIHTICKHKGGQWGGGRMLTLQSSSPFKIFLVKGGRQEKPTKQ